MSQRQSRRTKSASKTPTPTDLPYLKRDRQFGVDRVFVRRNGRTIRLRETPGTAAFAKEYTEAMAQLVADIARRKEADAKRKTLDQVKLRTFGWVAARYFTSGEFRNLDPKSQQTRRSVIEECLRETCNGALMRDCPVPQITSAKIKALRDAKASQRGAANNRRKYLSAMFGWAVEDGCMPSNPARDVRKLRYPSDGFHSWTVEEVAQFERRHPVGTKARLALGLLMFLGVRRDDVVRLGPDMVRDGVISFVPRKTRYKRTALSHKPILADLAQIIAASHTGQTTFLITAYGKPFSTAGFGNWFRARCNEAGLTHCSAHGLRKAGATLAANRGATVHQLMAIFDWTTPGQAEVYTRTADRKSLAGRAMGLLSREQGEN
jgi:integrase